MNRIPGVLWVAIVSLGAMVIIQALIGLSGRPGVLIGAILGGLVLYGIISGHKWAYVLTIIGVVLGTVSALMKSVEAGLAIFLLDCLVLVPVLKSTSYFFSDSDDFSD